MPEQYAKPHLSVGEHLDLLEGRGLQVGDRIAAEQTLRLVGYYRLSAYTYPFRQPLTKRERAQSGSRFSYRASGFIEGASFETVRDLYLFDRRLRLSMLDALEVVEVSLRSAVAHVLGRRDPFGHVHRASLNPTACGKLNRGTNRDAFSDWMDAYRKKQQAASQEDFVRHHLEKYREPLPVWVAVEFLDFGSTVRLLSLLRGDDRNTVAAMHGVGNGSLFIRWMRNLNYLRNVCAHHSRLWNRTLTYAYSKWRPRDASDYLSHVASSEPRNKVYIGLAVTAALIRHLDGRSPWPNDLSTLMLGFPEHPILSLQRDMGFPDGWQCQPIWCRT